MDQNLKTIFDFIQQNENLSADEKGTFSKAVKDVDKELTITTFKLDRTEKVKRTTAILLEETIEELEQKRKAVEAQNRELAIESSLERVRSVALSMQNPAEMVEVCRIISEQLELLNVKDIRNIQTAIIYESKGTYLNYEYYTRHDKLITTEVSYKTHHLQEEFAMQMIKGAGEFFSTSFTGQQVKDWYEYQKTTNQFVDFFLKEAKTLNYYMFSLGPVALGISTYSPLNEEEINLFNRFRNVFELAYRRFTDIEKALAQAREAQIELGLERVRARAMAMQNSSELAELVATLFKELIRLDFALTRCYIYIIDPESLALRAWTFNTEIDDLPESYYIKFLDLPYYKAMISAWKERNSSFVYELGGEEKKLADQVLFNETEYSRLPEAVKSGMTSVDRVFLSYSFNNFGGLQTGGLEPLSDENLDIFSRFGKVFDLTYTRFNDLKLAEAQAREAQIELALERVRARAMAMHNSSELAEVAALLFEQLKNLGVESYSSGFNIWDKEHKNLISWMSNPSGSLNPPFEMPMYDYEQFRRIYASWKKHYPFMEDDIKGKALIKHYKYLRSFPLLDDSFKIGEAAGFKVPDRQVHNIAFFSNGYLLFITHQPCVHSTMQFFSGLPKFSIKLTPVSSTSKKPKHRHGKLRLKRLCHGLPCKR